MKCAVVSLRTRTVRQQQMFQLISGLTVASGPSGDVHILSFWVDVIFMRSSAAATQEMHPGKSSDSQ